MFNEPQMTDLPAEKQAAKAIAHTLRNISERPGVAWYLGHGTQTYALLSEAHATLHGITMEEAQENWPPADQPEFDLANRNSCPFCGNSSTQQESEKEHHWIACLGCKATGPRVEEWYFDTKQEALDAAAEKWSERQMPR